MATAEQAAAPSLWSVKPIPADALATLSASDLAPEIPAPLLKILAQRGFSDPDSARAYLDPRLASLSDPFLLPDMKPAVDRILQAVDQNESIVIYGDYDVDGVTSITLLATILRAYGLDPIPFLPHRMDEGYGITREGLERCLESSSPTLLIAVDCGTTSLTELAWLADRGVDTIVIDHHEPSPDGRPTTVLALVNPKSEPGCEFTYFCTAGLIFKVAHALLKTRRLENFDLKSHLDIAAVGTVADIVPLIGENRIIVRHGLKQLESTNNLGLAALIENARVTSPIGAGDIGFRIGPRLNAAGRLDTAKDALDLLLGTNPSTVRALAEHLEQQNRQRQTVEQRIHDEAKATLPNPGDPDTPAGIVSASRDSHPGVVGIVASRIMRAHHRPTFVIAIDENGIGKGSGRSIPGVSLIAVIDACQDLLIKGGGHEMAAGISIEEKNIPAFAERFAAHIAELAGNSDAGDLLTPKITADAELDFSDVGFRLLNYNDLLEPLGAENPTPLFLTRGVTPAAEPRELKEKHLKLTLRQNGETREAIFFNHRLADLPRPPWDIAYRVERNVYRDRTTVQILLQHIRSTPS